MNHFACKIGILHLPGQGFTQGLAEALRAVYVPFVTGHKKQSKEWDALDVIPMRMADQEWPRKPLAPADIRF